MEIKAKEIKFVDVDALVLNPKNPNFHPETQIQRLSKIIEYQGFRNPVVVSNRSGFVVAGHGRIEVAKRLDMKQVPVIYQDFKDEAEEYAHMVADNAISEWAELKIPEIKLEIPNLPSLNIDMLGIKNLDKKAPEPTEVVFKYILEIECGSEIVQKELMTEMENRGYKVRPLI